MKYWWVNHKQTHKAEISGGYIWSPKTKKNGRLNQTYTNLTLTQPGDIVVSYAFGSIRAIGVVIKPFKGQHRPSVFGKVGDAWDSDGWVVPIEWKILKKPLYPKEFIAKIAALLPEKHSPIQKNGNGNQSCYLASISRDLGEFLTNLANEDNEFLQSNLSDIVDDVRSNLEEEVVNNSDIDFTEKEQIIKARRGQGKYRQNLEKVETECRVTGLAEKDLLIASHIKPWRCSSNKERMDGNNGLLLSPHIDKLFDKGFLSFKSDGAMVFASEKIARIMTIWGVDLERNVGRFNEAQLNYLDFHRHEIFARK